MFDFLKDLLQKRCLKRHTSKTNTGLTPIKNIHSAIAIIDYNDTDREKCISLFEAFCKKNNLKSQTIFFDLRRKKELREEYKDNLYPNDDKNFIYKKDINYFGKIKKAKIEKLKVFNAEILNSEMFISLLDLNDFPICFLTATSNAKFKLGRKQVQNNLFDIVITSKNKETSSVVSLNSFISLIEKIH